MSSDVLMKVACVIPTYNGCSDLLRLLDSLDSQTADFDVLVVDSNSSDGTKEFAPSRVGRFVEIDGSQFNHGGTRQMMVGANLEYDIFVFITQDAYMADAESIAKLVNLFSNPEVGAICGRQLPHLDASLVSAHARLFNYPDVTMVKSFSDAPRYGIKTPFISNSFSAYRKDALLDVGGFPSNVILSEDMYVAAKMLMKGWKIAYAGEARCFHSHNYTVVEEFKRYFDQGVFHSREAWIRDAFGEAGGEGLRYVRSELKFLGLRRIYLWPSAIFRNACKLLAYKLGQLESKIPVDLKRKLSMHKRFWTNTKSSLG